MPKTNKPLVRDGRIQVQKKRTDRSYLRPGSGATDAAPATETELEEVAVEEPEAVAETPVDAAPSPTAAFAPPPAAPAPAARVARTASNKLPTTVRAIQQQGVRKRREVDLGALAKRDTSYAYHELRRITVLATMVIVTLIVLWIVLR